MNIKKNIQIGWGYRMILSAGICWGFIGVFVNNLINAGASSHTIPFLRIACATVIMLPMIFIKGGFKSLRIDKRGLFFCVLLGVFCQAIFNFSYTKAIGSAGMSIAVALLYTSPVFVCIMSRILLKEMITVSKLTALFVNIAGCVLAVTGGDFSAAKVSAAGIVFGIISGFLYGLTTIIGKLATDRYDPVIVSFYSIASGTVIMTLIAAPWNNLADIFSFKILLLGLGYGAVCTVMPFILYFVGLHKITETSKVPVFASVETIVATGAGAAFFDESISLLKITGIALVIISIVIMNSGENGKHDTMK